MKNNIKIILSLLFFPLVLSNISYAQEIMPPLPIEVWNIFPDKGFFSFMNFNIINPKTFYTMLIVDLIIIIPSLIVYFQLKKGKDASVPGRLQCLLELIVEGFDNLVKDSMGIEKAAKYLPFIGTLFLFIFISNVIGIIPVPEFHIGGFRFPGFAEPTRDYNVPGSLAFLLVILIGHGSVIHYKGIGGYIKDYFSPIWLFFPLNIVGKFAEFVSVSFRLFGNIFGGGVVMAIIFAMPKFIQLPGIAQYMFGFVCTFITLFLNFFFGLFVGAVQAFVFTMLALTYISIGIIEEE